MKTQGDEGVCPGGTRVLKTGQLQSSPKYDRDDGCSATSGSGAHRRSFSSRDNTPDHVGFDTLLHQIQELQENKGQLEECLENLKYYHQQDYSAIVQTLQEERDRHERLEEQLNDLTELHQNDILNLKEDVASKEEKTAYQSYESATDIHEVLEACQTRLLKMELLQKQAVQLEGLENATVKTLLGKLINVMLAVMVVILLCVFAVVNGVLPLMKTCSHVLFVAFSFLLRHWDAMSEYPNYFFCTQPEKGDK